MGDLSRNLSYYEYLPKREYELLKKGKLPSRTLGLLINPRLIIADQAFIDRYGTTVINDWHSGGGYDESGYRPSDCKTGSFYSDHRFGMASDKKPKKTDIKDIFEDLKKKPELFWDMGFTHVESSELTPTWFHGSVAIDLMSKRLIIIGL